MKSQLSILLLLGFFVFTTTSCKEKLQDQIAGDWKVTSFKENGTELMGAGTDIISFTMEYEDYDGDEGDYTWVITEDDGSGGTDIETYNESYEVDNDEKTMEITLDNIKYTFEIDLDGDELELTGTIDGLNYKFKAERD